jgi:hypothetical protein
MNLNTCLDCEKQYSKSAPSCPNCGAPNLHLHFDSVINLLTSKGWQVLSKYPKQASLGIKYQDEKVSRVTQKDWTVWSILTLIGLFFWPLLIACLIMLIRLVIASYIPKTIPGAQENLEFKLNGKRYEFQTTSVTAKEHVSNYCTTNNLNFGFTENAT